VSAANAGALSVSGGVDLSYISLDDEVTGNPIGIGSNYTLSGSGEMDNGWTVGLDILMTNKNIYSNADVSLTIPAIGSFVISGGVSGTGIDRMDDSTPNVWEEAYGTGLSTGINTVSGTSGGAGIEWTPNMMPDGIVAKVAYSPNAAGAQNNDKASSGSSTSNGAGYDLTLELSDAVTGMSGMTVYGGISNVESVGVANNDGDREEMTIGIKYAMGGLTLGYQWSEEDIGVSAAEQAYDNEGYGITFAVNDDLSIGYNHYESEQSGSTAVTAEATSVQIAYSMGGASIRLAESSADNMDYNTGAAYDRDSTVISVSLAF
jgi:outer membrane protein OmpU